MAPGWIRRVSEQHWSEEANRDQLITTDTITDTVLYIIHPLPPLRFPSRSRELGRTEEEHSGANSMVGKNILVPIPMY
ncbi:hypothetical protein WISP_16719 [Willisornis vidua]|uniref:Uncharacterized protein n=1 Tax=Willisornis vidua TaxID=1566151 RepID=A0ABQ9DVK1_9PASS|nr:hypothetical protein WISP_16719 [Willisornis vidua]